MPTLGQVKYMKGKQTILMIIAMCVIGCGDTRGRIGYVYPGNEGSPEWEGAIGGYAVLAETEVSGREFRKIIQTVLELKNDHGYDFFCFSPRHCVEIDGIPKITHLICFSCGRTNVYEDHVFIRNDYIGSDRAILDEMFAKHGLVAPRDNLPGGIAPDESRTNDHPTNNE
jgi:hypothetical protein